MSSVNFTKLITVRRDTLVFWIPFPDTDSTNDNIGVVINIQLDVKHQLFMNTSFIKYFISQTN